MPHDAFGFIGLFKKHLRTSDADASPVCDMVGTIQMDGTYLHRGTWGRARWAEPLSLVVPLMSRPPIRSSCALRECGGKTARSSGLGRSVDGMWLE